MDEGQAGAEMPRYKCHKEVHALEIASVEKVLGKGVQIQPKDDSYAAFFVPPVERFLAAKPGDYYVVYEDGYASISPKKAFEDGYTRI